MEVWLSHDWPFWSLELLSYKTIDGRAINVVWLSSYMTTLWTLCSSSVWTSLWMEGLLAIWRTCNFGTHQLPSYSFVVSLDDDRNNDSLHFIWRGFFDAILIALNVFHVTCLIVATCRSFMGWSCKWGFLGFSKLNSHLSLQRPLISLFCLLSSPSFGVLSLHFLVSSSLSFSPLMFDYTDVRLDSSSVSFFFSRLRVFLESLGGHCPQVGWFMP